MPSIERALERGTQRGRRQLGAIAEELRERRLSLDLSQARVAEACGLSRTRYTRIEAGTINTLSMVELAEIASVLGLDSSVRLYPGGPGIRDAGHARKLQPILTLVRRPITFRLEVALPRPDDRPEWRAWDVVLFGRGERTAMELEMRLRDLQATKRRHDLKRRDDPTEHFVMLVADTRGNRRVLAEFEALLTDLPRLRPGVVRMALAEGRHPPTGFVLI